MRPGSGCREEKADLPLQKASRRALEWGANVASDQEGVLLGGAHLGGGTPTTKFSSGHAAKLRFFTVLAPTQQRQPWGLHHPGPPPGALVVLTGWGGTTPFAKPPRWMASSVAAESGVAISPVSQPSPLHRRSGWQPFISS